MFRPLLSRAAVLGGLAAIALTAGVLLISNGSTANAQSPTEPSASTGVTNDEHWPFRVQGRPTELERGATNGWYIWHDDDGFHIRTTTPSDRLHPFTAVLTTAGGTFGDVSKVRLEDADDIRLLDGGHRLVIKFHTHDGVDGVDFRTSGDHLRLRLEEFGQRVPTGHIFVGHFNVHPGGNPFGIER